MSEPRSLNDFKEKCVLFIECVQNKGSMDSTRKLWEEAVWCFFSLDYRIELIDSILATGYMEFINHIYVENARKYY